MCLRSFSVAASSLALAVLAASPAWANLDVRYVADGTKYHTLSAEEEEDRQFGAVFDGPATVSYEFSKQEVGPSVVRRIVYDPASLPNVVSTSDILPPVANHRLIPLSFSEHAGFLLLDLGVYDFFDKATMTFDWTEAGESYTSLLSADRERKVPLGRYTIPLSRISLCGEDVTAYYDYTERWVAGVFFGDDFGTKREFDPGQFPILQEPELVKTGERTAVVLLRAEGAGEIAFARTQDCGRTFSTVEGTGIPSPASMVRAVEHEERLLILHNRVASPKMGPRNQLDLTVTDLELHEQCTFNLIARNDEHMFSNFDMRVDDGFLQVAMQTYNFRTAKDSLGLLRMPLFQIECD